MSNDEKILGLSRPRNSVLDYGRDEIIAFLKNKLAGKKIVAAYLTGSLATDSAHHQKPGGQSKPKSSQPATTHLTETQVA